jgi:long-chain acyl-CoA synthetase
MKLKLTESAELELKVIMFHIYKAFLVGLGGKIGFYQGDIKKLTDDMKELKPTIFCTVPRLLNRIYAKVSLNLFMNNLSKK